MDHAQRSPAKPNRLIQEKSPYLLQHAYNPVDWYPWGKDAFEKANQEDKLVFLSIGYSTCHWCHVMAHESFEDAETAEMLNRWFVSIKVDREEYPDIDHIYMSAVMLMTGAGGWPLTVILTPDGRAVFGGTYFPPQRRGDLIGLQELLPAVAEAWKNRREELLSSAERLTTILKERLSTPHASGTLTIDPLHRAFNQAVAWFDSTYGGFGNAPKFPRGHELSFLLHYWLRTQTHQALELVTTTLDHLSQGGIHDHLGGGFHRYSTDAQWLVPHFEKMLYDQALLARAFLESYRVTQRQEYARVARGILDYVLRDLSDAAGAFYSAEDADSEGQEGKFYVWTPAEITELLGEKDAEWFNRYYGLTPEGNFEHGKSILHVTQPLEMFAKRNGLKARAFDERLAQNRVQLLAKRARRKRPHRDDKILTSWNGLMIASLAYGASTLHEPSYLIKARQAADFIWQHLQQDGLLLRRYREKEAAYPGTLEDYAFFGYGLLEVYESGYDVKYLVWAKRLVDVMIERFWDPQQEGFFLRDRTEPELIAPVKEFYDGATPSGNSMAIGLLLRLGRLRADPHLEDLGRRALESVVALVESEPFRYPQLLIDWDFALGPIREIVIVGDRDDSRTKEMIEVIDQRFLPRTVTVLRPTGSEAKELEGFAPYVQHQGPVNGQPTAYMCQGYVCTLPTTDPRILAERLDEGTSTRPDR